ncbi:DEAD/DEAH box helicase [Vulcanisaeta distributa]|uniref:DEAD/DEAH box helicase domain protein n=1 Tax=Vulcanisaeta distributa (strain DSM 14429 / JCM 11212 / NBRC 100878 / IC-017) TaxID=572478 RepID=E1QU45_VULDI|nr:DEAD/DEAH box helicase [Vulcanisaeta distributa]ADN51039.1 DEAD/DEAH box helicase domain protein [Vulcanisaeta distributa DSM 14429]
MIRGDRLTVAKYMLEDEFIGELGSDRARMILYVHEDKPSEPSYGPPIDSLDLPKELIDKLRSFGIDRLYDFQWEAYQSIINGNNTVIMAGTGVGKTEAFLLPLITMIGREGIKAMIMYPTKALARDQLLRMQRYFTAINVSVMPYDGDTPSDIRSKIYSSPPDILITNPDMVSEALTHVGKFRDLLRNYGVVVLDDFHVYNGVFGAHVHYVLKRMRRFMRNYQFVVSTATVGNPVDFARELLGVDDVRLIRGPEGRRGLVRHVLVSPISRGRLAEAAELARVCVRRGMKCLVFADSHRFVELIKRFVDKAGFGDRVRVHRAGLTIEERHEVEDGFREGRYLVLLTTPTLEMGIDVGDADVAVMATIPPSYSKYLQRSGRVGRRGQRAYVIQVLGDDPMSTYYSSNPREFYMRKPEDLYVEWRNDEIAKRHCLLMAYERPVRSSSVDLYCEEVLKSLVSEGLVEVRGNYYVVSSKGREVAKAMHGIRGIGDVVKIVEGRRVIGHRELPMALRELHDGAIYLHGGRVYEVYKLDLGSRTAHVRRLPNDYDLYTTALYISEPKIDEVLEEGFIKSVPYQYVRLTIKEVVHGYVVKRFGSGEVVERREFNESFTYEFRTKGIIIYAPFITFSPFENVDVVERGRAYHAAEHIMIMVGENVVGAGPTDLGGISYPTGHIIIYDSYPGGSGTAKMLLKNIDEVLKISLNVLTHCTCIDGCPKCVYSPYCGNDNHYLSRRNAIRVIDAIIKGVSSRITELPNEGSYD